MSDFESSLALLEQLYRRPVEPAAVTGLRRIERLLSAIGNPHRAFRSVHVAGSSGKGSTTTMIGNILQAAGYRTGFFRSPHLTRYTERIVIDGSEITPEEWVACFAEVWPVVAAMSEGSLEDYNLGRPSLFEVLFALAALAFARSGVQWGAIETGMGGRLDATNSLLPDVAIIASISLEHTKILGDTIEQIAGEKAAVIKPGMDAVAATGDETAQGVVRARARAVGARLWEIPGDSSSEVCEASIDGTSMVIHLPDSDVPVRLRLAGGFQATNATAAATAAYALRQRDVDLPVDAVVRGLESTTLGGRFEVAGTEPLIILDGAHHPAAAAAFAAALEELLPGRPLVLLFAALGDKDIRAMAQALEPRAEVVILTEVPDTPRAMPLDELRRRFGPTHAPLYCVADPSEALERARAEAVGDRVLAVCGSLYLVGWAREHLPQSVRP